MKRKEKNTGIPTNFIFTVENLLDNLDKLGPWSMYALASEALSFYYPDLYNDETGECPEVMEEVELTKKLGCQYWDELVIKFHKEIGYKPLDGIFSSDYVNVY